MSATPVSTMCAVATASTELAGVPRRTAESSACSTAVRIAPLGSSTFSQARSAACMAGQSSWPSATISGTLSVSTAYSMLASTPE